MAGDDAPADDLIVNDALVKRVLMFGRGAADSPFWLRMLSCLIKAEERTPDLSKRWLKFSNLSDDERKNLRDKQVIDIIDYNFNKADEVNDSKKADAVITIYLKGCDGITDATLDHIANNCTNLDKLEVSGCDQITDDGIKAIVEKIGNKLTELDYSGCTRCTDAALQAIVQHCPNLRVLNADNTGITQIPDSIGYGNKLPKLRKLNLRKNKIKAIPLSIFAFLENATRFEIGDNPLTDPPLEIAQEGKKAIIKYLTRKQGLEQENDVGGVSDSPNFDPDRLGVSVYAEAISAVAENVETPENSLCVALFGRWGAGKTFLYKLIRQARKAKADETNRERLLELEEERKHQSIFLKSNERSLQSICNLIALVCCCCQQNKSESIATLVPLFCPIWICLYLISLPVSFYIELFRLYEKFILSSIWIFPYFVTLPLSCCLDRIVPCRAFRRKIMGNIYHDGLKKIVDFLSIFALSSMKLAVGLQFMVCIVTLPITLPGLLFLLVRKIFEKTRNRIYIRGGKGQQEIDAKDNDAPPWRDVKDILTGNVSLHSKTLYNDRSSYWAFLQLIILSAMQPIFKFIQSRWNPISFFWSYSSRNRQFEVRHDMTKSIDVNCNAWLYNGTDVIWAAILEEIWTEVEAEYGTYTVRFHRFLISISPESKSDDRKVKESKRRTALLMLIIKVIFYFVLAAVTTFFLDDIVKFSEVNLSKVSNLILPASLYTIPSIPLLKDTIKLFLHLIGKSKGTKILQQAQALAKHKRFDFKEKTGFMGVVKTEVEYLYDFLITEHIVDWKHQVLRPGRLNIMLDDLDRCDPDTIMGMLEAAMLLLLIDAPVTCWIPIDSQVIVASIEKKFGQEFLQEGIDGYSFLEKIIQLPFCIPDLESNQKVAFFEKICEKGELNPRRLYERLQYLDEKADLKEFRFLLRNKRTLTKDEKVLPEELLPALESMVLDPDILNYDEENSCFFDSPKEVLAKVRRIVSSKRALEGKLEEEFLNFISVGIEELLERRDSRLKEEEFSTPLPPQARAPETPPNLASNDDPVETPAASNSGDLGITGSTSSPDAEESSKQLRTQDRGAREPPPTHVSGDDDENISSAVTGSNFDIAGTSPLVVPDSPAAPSLGLDMTNNTPRQPDQDMISYIDEETPPDTLSSYEKNMQWYKKIYQPIMNPLERSWFGKYADYFVGKPRKMKRMMNSYMVSRIVAKKLRPNLVSQKEFGEKLLKLIILCEQWPYRMAWFLVVAENIQQEKSLQDQRRIESQNPIGDTLTNIISKSLGVPEKGIMDLPLLTVYHQLVQSVIHSPETADTLLQRDSDPQVFEILLAESYAPLKLKDVASSSSAYDSTSQTTTVRPYLFNMQMHMTDKVQNYVDNCMLHLVESRSKKMNHAVYQKKPDFFNQEYDPIPSPIEKVEADSKKPRFFNQEYPTPSPVEIEEANSKADFQERSLRSDVEIAQLEADEALREREIRMEELMKAADKSANLIQFFKEEFVKAKEVSDEKNARLQAAKTALVKFQSGITVNE